MADTITHVHDFIPEFDLSARYCYFLDLFLSSAEQTGSLRAAKRELFSKAGHAILAPIQKQLVIKDTDEEAISSAIEFLRLAAQSERNKEISIVKQYIDDIKKDPTLKALLESDSKNGKDLRNLIKDLEDFSNKPTKKDMTHFYQRLVLLINTIKSSFINYKTRLNQLASKNRTTTDAIRRDFYATRLPTDIDTLFKTMMGTLTRQDADSMAIKISRRVIEFVQKKLQGNQMFLEHPFEVLAGIMTDFEVFLQTKFNKEQGSDKPPEALNELQIDKYFDEYELMQTEYLTALLSQSQELEQILKTIAAQTGLKKIAPDTEIAIRQKRRLDNNRRTKVGKERIALHNDLKTILGKQYSKNIGTSFSWELRSKTGKHGSVYEMILPIISKRAFKINASSATDILEVKIGTLEMSIENDSKLTSVGREITQAIEKRVRKVRKDRFDDLILATQEMNEEIQKASKKIDDLLEQENIPDDVFIYHDSLKLYTEIEQHKGKGFHGRDIQILTAYSQLYSANNIAGLNLPSQEIFYNLAVNLSRLAIGGGIVEEVENYLSIFAGLLMFDDVQNIALDVAKNTINQVQETGHGSVKHIHLYLLNDIYIPGSLLLTSISLALQNGYDHIRASIGARAEITTKDSDEEIESYLAQKTRKNYSINDWNDEANKIVSGTNVKIIFLTSFISLIKSLQKYMK